MENKSINIPDSIQIAGQEITVEIVEKLGTNLGVCCLAQSYIHIAKNTCAKMKSKNKVKPLKNKLFGMN